MKNRDLARRNETLVQEDERLRGWLDDVSSHLIAPKEGSHLRKQKT